MMTPERWRQVDGVLQQAQELEGDALRRFLDAACAGDEELRREVESLLAAERAEDNFLSQPVMEVAAGIIANNSTGRETAQQYDDQLPSNAPTLIKAGQDDGQLRLGLMQGVLLDGRYLIERELGRGGIGVVFLAQDQRLSGKRVVIKVLLEHWLKTDNRLWFERKFREEIKALALIDHPGVVPALDVGQLPDGRSYLVMQFVAGEPLSQSISPSGIALKRAANLIHQIALALYAAHEKGVIHRDLKPDNILLQTVDGEERIKLIDFGIATVRDAIGTGSSSTTVVAGTPRYMAPEQLQGKPEKASDTYALGVIIYQLVTGQLPFNSKTLTEIAAEQRAGIKVRPRDLHPDLPEAAERAILKALAIDPANRYQDAREFGNQFRQAIEAVDPFQTNIGVSLQEDAPVYSDAPPTQRFPSRRRFLISAATLLAMLLLGALAWRGLRFDRTDSGNNPPVNPKPTLPAVTERTVSYSFWLKRAAHPRNVEPVLSRDLIGGPRDEFRIN
ncbi:MAG TPA: serine/threonine-protein kinase, partial [Blastocatellia bacterium]|nr:serine/threonine-protein kinase [Blastocatellia bacterium]